MTAKRSRDEEDVASDNASLAASVVARQDGKAAQSCGADLDEERENKRRRSEGDEWHDIDRAARRKLKKLAGSYPALHHSGDYKITSHIKISDLQNLILYLLADGVAPQWISVRHHHNFDKVVVLMVPGLDSKLFDKTVPLDDSVEPYVDGQSNGNQTRAGEDEEQHGAGDDPLQRLVLPPADCYPTKLTVQKMPPVLRPLQEIFSKIWPIKTPGDFRKMHSPMYAMLSSPIPRLKAEKNMKGPRPPVEGKTWEDKRTPITEFIASRPELLENGYAIHPAHLNSSSEIETEAARRYRAVQSHEDGWVDILDIKSLDEGAAPESDIEAGSILQGRQLLVMDCEMVTTTLERFSLARVSLLDWDGNTVMDELVKQPAPVKDYLTPFSGITKEMLDTATLTLPDIQARLESILTPQTILAGHSLDSDFRALKMSFPFIIDTALLYPHPKGPPQKSSLKFLTQKYLSREIQKSSTTGHDSVEDAKACLDLVKQKCEKGKTWGTSEASGESIFKRLARTGRLPPHPAPATNDHRSPQQPRQTGAIIDWTGNMHGFGATATAAISCSSDDEVEAGVIRCVTGSSSTDGPVVPEGGVGFTFARLRELEFARGWSPSLHPSSTPSPPTVDSQTSTRGLTLTVRKTVAHIRAVFDALPPRTAFIVLSGSGDPREMLRLQALHAQHKAEFLVKKWDELSTKWTDTEEKALKEAVEDARRGVGFLAVRGDERLWGHWRGRMEREGK